MKNWKVVGKKYILSAFVHHFSEIGKNLHSMGVMGCHSKFSV